MRVAELEGETLDLWVARALGYASRDDVPSPLTGEWSDGSGMQNDWQPSGDWFQAGPIIESEHIEILYYGQDGTNLAGNPWEAQIGCDTHYIDQGPGDAMGGPTPLVAAMRAFVALKFGEEVNDAPLVRAD